MLVPVQLLRAPVLLWERSGIHTAELIREFSLLTIGLRHRDDPPDPDRVPARLVALADGLRTRYAGVSQDQAQVLDDVLSSGGTSHDFTYHVPPAVAQACQDLQDLLEEADAYCEDGALLTLVSPPDQRAFRRWYLQEFIRQVDGHPPTPWPGSLD